jgi:hypothetical protein
MGPPPGGAPAGGAPAGPKGAAPPASATLHGTKAAGGGQHQKGGATRENSGSGLISEELNGNAMFGDMAYLGGGAGLINESSTIHAAIAHRLGESEPVRLSSAQLAEFKKLFDKNYSQRPVASIERNAYIPNDFSDNEWLALGDDASISENFLAEFGADVPIVPLTPALRRPFVEFPPEFSPQSAQDEAMLLRYTADPRAGFAPEGVPAFLAWMQYGLELDRTGHGTFDFVDAQSGEGWHVVPVRHNAAKPIGELQNAVKNAAAQNAHLLFDASHLTTIDGQLGNAVNEFVKSARTNRVEVIHGPTRMILSSAAAAA